MGRRQKITTWRRYNWLAYAALMKFSSDIRERPLFQSSLACYTFDYFTMRATSISHLPLELSFQRASLWRQVNVSRRKRQPLFQSPMPVICDNAIWQLLNQFVAASNCRQVTMRTVLDRSGPRRAIGRRVWATLQTRISPIANRTFLCSQDAVRCVTHYFREYL